MRFVLCMSFMFFDGGVTDLAAGCVTKKTFKVTGKYKQMQVKGWLAILAAFLT